MTRILIYILCIVTIAFGLSKRSESADSLLQNPVIEKRAHKLNKELRCLVCQNQAIVDSNAPLAKQLKQIVRERIAAGDSDKEVKLYLIDRYGDWILLRPPFKTTTALLWLSPFFILLLALIFGGRYLFQHQVSRHLSNSKPLTEEEQKRLQTILNNNP